MKQFHHSLFIHQGRSADNDQCPAPPVQTIRRTVPSIATENSHAAVQALLRNAFIGYMLVDLGDAGISFDSSSSSARATLDAVRQQALADKMLREGVKPFEHPMNACCRRANTPHRDDISSTCHSTMAKAVWAHQGARLPAPYVLSGSIRAQVIATFRSTLEQEIIPRQQETLRNLRNEGDDRVRIAKASETLQERLAQLAQYHEWPIRLYDRGMSLSSIFTSR